MRFFIPIALACGRAVRLEGSRTLLSRPMDVYADICRPVSYTNLDVYKRQTIINAISYVLIAFVAISLVVSSIMIGCLLYTSRCV